MFKIACLVLAVAALASASDYRIAGTSITTAPYTKMTLASTTTSGKAYTATFVHTASETWTADQGTQSFCCATAVSDSSRSSAIKDKCFILQIKCATGGTACDTSATSVSAEIRSGTYASTGITVGTGSFTLSPALTVSTKVYTTGYTMTEAEANAFGLPHVMSPSYKVDVKCWYELKKTSFTTFSTGSVLTASLPSATTTFTIGSGAFSTILSVGVFSVVSAFYALF